MLITFRVLTGLGALLFLVSALRWAVDPGGAAAGLQMPALTGIGLSSQMGDVGGFFLAGGIMMALGAIRLQPVLLEAAALMIAAAAGYRLLAWLAHGAPFAGPFIAVEVVLAGIAIVTANRVRAST